MSAQTNTVADTDYSFDPDYFLPPTSGTAGNGLPIYNYDRAAQQLVRSTPGWNLPSASR